MASVSLPERDERVLTHVSTTPLSASLLGSCLAIALKAVCLLSELEDMDSPSAAARDTVAVKKAPEVPCQLSILSARAYSSGSTLE